MGRRKGERETQNDINSGCHLPSISPSTCLHRESGRGVLYVQMPRAVNFLLQVWVQSEDTCSGP